MIETIVRVDGMMCGMCESHINDAVRSHFQVKKVSSSHTKGQTVIQSQEPLDREQLAELQQATEGWMAAVYLHLQALADRGTAPAETAALERAEAFNSRFRDWAGADGFDEVTAWAEEELAFRTESGGNWTPYTLELDCSVYQTEQMVCIQAEYYSYTGGAHPNTVLLAWNFDLMTGQFFAPEILAADGQIFLDAVRDEIIRQIDMTPEAAVEAGYWEDYQDIAANWSSYAVSFNEEGMTVAFSPYEIACYAMGPQEFRLSYEQLAPHLNSHGRDLLGIGKN